MADNDEFLKKVYDRYLGTDYTYGVSNLNPKREISKVEIVNPQTEESKILAQVKARLEEIKSVAAVVTSYNTPKTNTNNDFTTTSGNMGGGGGANPATSVSESQAITNSGGMSSVIYVPGITTNSGPIDPLMKEVQELILNLTPFVGPAGVSGLSAKSDNDSADNVGDHEGINEIGNLSVFQLDCDGLSYEDIMNSSSSSNSDKTDDGSNGDSDSNSNSDSGSDGGSGSDNGSSSNSADSGSSSIDGIPTQDGPSNEDAAASKAQSELAACAVQQLGFLKAILAILKVISMIRKVLIQILSIIVPIVKLVTLAAQCWINPPAAAEIIQLVAEKIAAILTKLIGELLQAIWDSLQGDCLTSAVQSVLDQINQALAGIGTILNSPGQMISFVQKTAKNQIVDPFKNIHWEDAAANWKKAYDPKSIQKALEKAYKDNNLTKILQSAIPPAAKAAWNTAVQSAKDAVKNANTIVQSTGTNTGMSTASAEAIAKLDAVKVL